MKTNKELIKGAAHYFEKNEIKLMYATPDGSYFYESGHNYATSHLQRLDIADGKVLTIL